MRTFGELHFENRLHDSAVFEHPELGPILRAALKKLDLPYGDRPPPGSLDWNEDFFGLSSLSLYQTASATERHQILWHCNRMALEEAFFIEKTGMTYAAKMALLADTNDKRALYNLFCADEASHFHAISAFLLAEPKDASEQPFLLMLDSLIHEGSYLSLVYMIQIILEGWGLHHYRQLAAHCQDPALTEVFRSIVLDEAKHHGSGLVILPQEDWTSRDTEVCRPYLVAFMKLVQAGPLNLIKALEYVLGPLTVEARVKLFEESEAELNIARNVKTLRTFICEHCPDPQLLVALKLGPLNVDP